MIGPSSLALLWSSIQAVATHGAAVGEVTPTGCVIWSRADREARMEVSVEPSDGGAIVRGAIEVKAEADFTGKVLVEGLRPDTTYRYRVRFAVESEGRGDERDEVGGTFRTAPAPGDEAAARFAWGGDLGGQNVCRDDREGYPIFDVIRDFRSGPDFFIGLGDMIYADNLCEPVGRYRNRQVPGGPLATGLPSFWEKWKYNREDASFRRLLSETPYYAIWDDHEVVNDFGPLHDTRREEPYREDVHLMPIGLRAFFDYHPLLPAPETPGRLYRRVRWGKHLEVFFLDNRQYRDANRAPDAPERPKTMLGREQLTWLKDRLRASEATWKVLVSTVPLSIPTGSPAEAGRDGWADFDQDTGFETELRDLLGDARRAGVRNLLFITTDVHFAAVFRYTPFPDATDFEIHEVVTGPLQAGVFPNRNFDRSLGTQRLFFHGPESAESIGSFEEAKGWFNFGAVAIDRAGVLEFAIVNGLGEVVYQQKLQPWQSEGDKS